MQWLFSLYTVYWGPSVHCILDKHNIMIARDCTCIFVSYWGIAMLECSCSSCFWKQADCCNWYHRRCVWLIWKLLERLTSWCLWESPGDHVGSDWVVGRSRMPLRRAKCRTFECRWHFSAQNDGLARSKMKLMVGTFKPLLMGLSRTNATTFVWVVWLMTILYYRCHSSSLWLSIWLALHSTLRTFS